MSLYDVIHDIFHIIFDGMSPMAILLTLILVWICTVAGVIIASIVVFRIMRDIGGDDS
jgi:hypothetical protein